MLAENWPNGGWVLSPCETRIFLTSGRRAVANLPSIKGAGVQNYALPGPKTPCQTVTYPSRPSCAIYREAAAVSSSADRDALSRGYANASLARVRRISNFAASTRGSPRPPRPPRLQAFSIPITACAARFSSKDGQHTIRFRGGLTVRISSSPAGSPVRTGLSGTNPIDDLRSPAPPPLLGACRTRANLASELVAATKQRSE